MNYKSRTPSTELLVLESLNYRLNLSEQDQQYYQNLKKGFEGELTFDSIVKSNLQCDCYIFNDLLLTYNKTTFQIDSLFILSNKIIFYEIKNFEGDFYYENDKIFTKTRAEIPNPLNQLSRTETLLKQFVKSLGINFHIEGYVIFINPEFTLYHAPMNKSFILPTQINRHFKQIELSSSKLSTIHKKLADKMASLHILDSKFSNLPEYKYDQLKKGIVCAECRSFSVFISKRKCLCKDCGYIEPATTAILRSVEEFKLLFPDEKITTNVIHDWCQVVESKKRVQRVLDRNFTTVGFGRWVYYSKVDK